MARKHSRAVLRAAIIAAFVGTLIVMINHGDHILQEPVCPHFTIKAALSYLTPFVVSLVTSMLATREAVTDRRG
ncbi:MAG: nitrate/nitrite transporter NrtS [Kofleriaceae bacterium]